MELTYTKVGDYYIPNLALDDDAEYEIGIYGRMRQQYLEEHHHGTYTSLLLIGKLWKHLADIDAACHERMDFLILAMAKRENVTEALKATDQMEWVGRMNNIRNRAEEIVLHELVYA
ncbi:TnpV protein [Enterocloster clostridioformis]|uniref:TnpV protein n=1 Tax=Enterocloster clostridioformis TaxID=1531 RepID=UPI00080C825A|nr:TnpV protein [Enterocloster clostridioformis]ANU45669.1 TnpV protein [Lachnoclostridium sp. YL32]NDO30471.1 TnpV protein [Enterocloster clostridioformis]OXE67823.1 TnpV protein [Enterocloster clostridioformis]QQQ99579.1 TnpV protein [Enterocloster clostridioformis]